MLAMLSAFILMFKPASWHSPAEAGPLFCSALPMSGGQKPLQLLPLPRLSSSSNSRSPSSMSALLLLPKVTFHRGSFSFFPILAGVQEEVFSFLPIPTSVP